jgi:hypothetical protein
VDGVIVEAVEFADASPEPPLESLYENLYVLGEGVRGWYAVDERTPDPHRGEDEHEVGASGRPKELAEAGAAYAGQVPSTKRRSDADGGGYEDEEAAEAVRGADEEDGG